MTFAQAPIAVENVQAFGELRGMIDTALAPANIAKFFKQAEAKKILIRDLEAVLQKGLLKADQNDSGEASGIYNALSLPDQGQMREHYLTRVEEVDEKIRDKYKKLYRYS